MRNLLSARSAKALSLAVLLLFGTSLWAQVPKQAVSSHNVLILNSFNQDTEPYAEVRDEFMRQLQATLHQELVFVQFDLQQRSDNQQTSDAIRAQLLRNQYVGAQPDLVVAIGPPAVEFWQKYRAQVFPQIPTLVAGSEIMLKRFVQQPIDAVVVNQWTFEEVTDNILQLLPGTRRILVVFGASENERGLTAMAKKSLQRYQDIVDFVYSTDMSIGTLRQQLTELPADSAVLFGILDSDAAGVILGGESGLALVRAASPVPVFGFFEEQMGEGIIGGPLIPLQQTSMQMVQSAIEMLRDGFASVKTRKLPMITPTYDWAELQKWSVDTARLPANAIVRFKPQSAWDVYARWIILAVVVLLIQAVLIVGLLLQRRQRRVAEKFSLNLSRRLITAHEDEQRRIARELHDDLSQRLARLSIDAGYLAANPRGDAAAEVARDMQPRLVSISKDVHDMSYLLHPAMVHDLGIAAALNSECERTQRRCEAAIIERISDVPREVPQDTSLAVFRIAQQALHNAEQHAQAQIIELNLDYDGTAFILNVRDDGVGFDPSARSAGHGLGLFSMQERAKLVNGTLKISSVPGVGTNVLAVIPLAGSTA